MRKEERAVAMSEQPTALRLAKWLDAMPSSGYALTNQAAAELRRLHEVNQALLEALKELVAQHEASFFTAQVSGAAMTNARAAIAKGEQA